MATALNCCKTLCCILLVFVNVISIIFGVLLAILGILILWGSALIRSISNAAQSSGGAGANQTSASFFGSGVSVENYYTSLAALTGSAAGLLIAFGIIIVMVSCIGCFGACIGIPACLIIYVVCVSVLFAGQLIVIIIWFANSNTFKQSIRGTLEQQVQKYRGDQNQNFESATLNMIQVLFGCCGVDNGTDFRVSSPAWNRTHSIVDKDNKTITFNLTYPASCCKYNLNTYRLADPYCPYNGTRSDAVSNYRVGCYEKVWLVAVTYWQLDRFFYGLCGCLGLELLLILGAIVICCVKMRQAQGLSGSHAEVEYSRVKMMQQKS